MLDNFSNLELFELSITCSCLIPSCSSLRRSISLDLDVSFSPFETVGPIDVDLLKFELAVVAWLFGVAVSEEAESKEEYVEQHENLKKKRKKRDRNQENCRASSVLVPDLTY